jgi:hypothetical protein
MDWRRIQELGMRDLGSAGRRALLIGLVLVTFLVGKGWTQDEPIQVSAWLGSVDGTIRLAALTWMHERVRQLQTNLRQAAPDARKKMLQELQSLRSLAAKVAEMARNDREPMVREAAIHTLAALQPDLRNEEVRQTWAALLQDRSPKVALAAAESLAEWLEFSLRELNNPHAELRTLELVERLAADLLALQTVWDLGLRHDEIAVRQATLRTLHGALTALPQRLIGQQDAFREEKMRASTLAAVRDLTALLEHLGSPLADNLALPHASVRQLIGETLEALGELPPLLRHSDLQPAGEKMAVRLEQQLRQFIPALLRVVREDRSAAAKLAAASALENITPINSETYQSLLAGLAGDNPWVRWTMARCLTANRAAHLRQEEQEHIARVLAARLLEEDELGVRLRLAQTLRTWNRCLDAARQELGELLLQMTMPWPGIPAGPFAPAHVGVAQPQRDPQVLQEVLTAIREFAEQRRGNLPGEWLAGLEMALRSETAAVRIEACRVLEHYGSRAYHLRPALTALLRDSDPQVRGAAARTLLRISPPID